MFSDFLGICMTYQERGIENDFLSCFPLQDHFLYLANQKSPAFSDIKFGKYGQEGKEIWTYSRAQFCQRKYFWQQVGADQIVTKVKDWITKVQAQAGPADTVQINFKAHGSQNGALRLGSGSLHPVVFSHLLKDFHPETLVYVVVSACNSGEFIHVFQKSAQPNRIISTSAPQNTSSYADSRSVSDRARNGRFIGAWVAALTTVEIPDCPPRAERATWTLTEHANFIEKRLTRDITPTTPASQIVPPQFWHSSDIDPSQQFEATVLRCMDTKSAPQPPSSNQRIEWPTLNKDILPHLSKRPLTATPPSTDGSSEAVAESAVALAQHEVANCDDRGLVTDLLIHDEMSSKAPDWKSIIRNLWWRGRRQSAIWKLFQALVDKGLINPDCLTVPVDLYGATDDTHFVAKFLYCLSNVQRDSDLVFSGKISLQSSEYNADLEW
jgi:hypothetical protein